MFWRGHSLFKDASCWWTLIRGSRYSKWHCLATLLQAPFIERVNQPPWTNRASYWYVSKTMRNMGSSSLLGWSIICFTLCLLLDHEGFRKRSISAILMAWETEAWVTVGILQFRTDVLACAINGFTQLNHSHQSVYILGLFICYGQCMKRFLKLGKGLESGLHIFLQFWVSSLPPCALVLTRTLGREHVLQIWCQWDFSHAWCVRR